MGASQAQGTSKFVEDLGAAAGFRVTDLPGAPATMFYETAADFASLPAPAERPPGWPAFVEDTNTVLVRGRLPDGTAAWVSAGANIAQGYAGAKSYQPGSVDLTLTAGAGKDVGVGTAYLAAYMGNILGDALTKTGDYLAGLIGAYSITGAKGTHYPAGAVLGQITDGVTEADGAFVAYIDGDSAVTTAGAAFKVRSNNSNAASGFGFGLDLQDAAHDGYQPVDSDFYLSAELRLTEDACIKVGKVAPVDGTTGTGVTGPGSLYIDGVAGKAYINTGSKAATVWKEISHA